MPDFMNVATLTKQVNNNLPAKRFLSSFFEPVHLKTLNAELDTVEGSRVIAPFKREGAKRTVTKRGGYTKRPFHCLAWNARPTQWMCSRPSRVNRPPSLTRWTRMNARLTSWVRIRSI